jgi:O-antigen/teichoic acid export membrane protein
VGVQPGPPELAEAAGESGGLAHQAASGVAWLTLQKWAVRIFGFVTIAILTRFLAPADFGTVAAASTVLPFFYLLADLGFTAYVVQAEEAGPRVLNTSFWFSALAGGALFGLLLAVAPLMGPVFGSPQVVPVLQVMAVTVVLTALASVPTAILRRSMRFRAVAVQSGIAAVIAQVVAVAMTLTGQGVWALVAQVVVSQACATVLAWVAAGWRPGWTFSRQEFRRMAKFGTQVVGVEFVAMSRAWGEAAIVSATLGLATLGYLNIAQRLVAIVQDLTGAALIPVSTVAFARLRSFVDRLRQAYLKALRLTYGLMAPPLVVLAVAAPLIVPIVFGDGWAPSYQAAQILALAGSITVGASLDHGLFYGLGKPGRWFLYALATDVLTVATTAFCTRWGLIGVATGFLVVSLAATIFRWFLVARLLSSPVRQIAGPFGFLAVALVVSGSAGLGVARITGGLADIWVVVLVVIAIGVSHLAVMATMARPAIHDILRLLARSQWLGRLPVVSKYKEVADDPEIT